MPRQTKAQREHALAVEALADRYAETTYRQEMRLFFRWWYTPKPMTLRDLTDTQLMRLYGRVCWTVRVLGEPEDVFADRPGMQALLLDIMIEYRNRDLTNGDQS